MKTKIQKIFVLKAAIISSIILVGSLTGCEDFLDRQPLDQLSTETFWKTESDAMLALTGVYFIEGQNATGAKQNYDLWNQDAHLRLFEATTDNGFEKDNGVTDFNNGDLTPAYGPVRDLWTTCYRKIAKCNNFLDHIDNVTMDQNKLAEMKAEVRAIRAFDYFYLAFLWGDVPLVKTVLSVDESNTVTRNSRAEVMTFVIDELKSAISDLPVSRPNEQRGRITKGGALGMLGRVYLAEKKWEDAKSIYKQIMDLNIYIIDPRFKELFEDGGENSQEIILTSKRMPEIYGNSLHLSCLGFTWGGYHHYSPYNELVEEFECIDGKPISESPLYNIDKPYENRDPRLLKTIFVDAITRYKGTIYVAHPDSSPSKYPDQLTRRPWSGYMLKKFCDEGYSGDVRVYGGDFPMIRYAEVLLSYLEANIESGTSITQDLLDQTINKVRSRTEISMPPVTETDPTKLKIILRRERRVELAWEGLRLYDLLRWRIAHINLKGRVHGMKLCTSEQAPTYTKFPVNSNGYYFCEETFFRENVDYLWPIPQTERDVNPNLTQNQGY
ncbi:MAG TPA: RagB/SusD family nutrient uptake outer membrane protein [Candidatus Cloacimonadota bacterium]|nr:RagB/SusD family nutrient uptake outer membrane protein [Candidatus Cloacimonadota bacterium]